MATSLKKHLQQLSKEELIEEIMNLSKKFKDVKTYYEMDLGGTAQQTLIVNEVKRKLKKEFVPRGDHPKAAVLRKLISDFKKISVFPHDVADVLLYRVELAVEFTNQYGDMWEAFYTATENAYEEALKLIKKHGEEAYFKERCREIQRQTADSGWGFGDTMSELTQDYF